jgi:hypothetical protein
MELVITAVKPNGFQKARRDKRELRAGIEMIQDGKHWQCQCSRLALIQLFLSPELYFTVQFVLKT